MTTTFDFKIFSDLIQLTITEPRAQKYFKLLSWITYNLPLKIPLLTSTEYTLSDTKGDLLEV